MTSPSGWPRNDNSHDIRPEVVSQHRGLRAHPTYRGVEVRSHARLTIAAGGDAVRRIAARYLDAEAGATHAERASDDVLFRLEPGDLRAWGLADQFPLTRSGCVGRAGLRTCRSGKGAV